MRSFIFICFILALGTMALSAGLWLPSAAAAPLVLTPVTAADVKAKLTKAGTQASVVNIWATWCAPCKEELPEFVQLKKAYEKRGVQLVLVSADGPDDLKDASLFLDKVGVDFPSFRLGEDPEKFVKALEPTWSATLPTTVMFDATGKKVKTWVGRIRLKTLEAELDKLLKDSKGSGKGGGKALLATPRKISSY